MAQTAPVSLAEHPAAQRWLTNFDSDGDSDIASMLLDEMEVFSRDSVANGLREALGDYHERHQGRILLLPPRAVAGRKNPPPLFSSPTREASLQVIDPSDDGGSLGLVLNTLRASCAVHERFVGHPTTINELRDLKVDRFLLVDDISGSGSRAARYQQQLRRHPTIKSWISFGYMAPVDLLVFTATPMALSRFRRLKGAGDAEMIRPSKRLADLKPDKRGSIESLANRYVHKSHRSYSLGFMGTGALTGFAYSTPNNTPAILWQTEGPSSSNGPWQPLSQHRTPPIRFANGAEKDAWRKEVGRARMLWQSERVLAGMGVPVELIAVLAAVRRGAPDTATVAVMANREEDEIAATIGTAEMLGLIDGFRLTEPGARELLHVRRLARQRPARQRPIATNQAPYYPSQLRPGGRLL